MNHRNQELSQVPTGLPEPDGPGLTYGVRIEQGKISEFARATWSDNPAYDGPAAIVPPTFLTTAISFSGREAEIGDELGFSMSRVLHGEEECEFFGTPPRAGQQLTAETRVSDRWVRAGERGGVLRFARLVTEFRDDAGTLVAAQRSTIIETGAPTKRAG